MRRAVLFLFVAACSSPGTSVTTSSGSTGAGGSPSSTSASSAGTGGAMTTATTGSGSGDGDAGPPACKTGKDCPLAFPGQPICTVTACDTTGVQTYPGLKIGCYLQDVALFTECFVMCPGFCSGSDPGGGGTPPWTCVYPPGSACLDGG